MEIDAILSLAELPALPQRDLRAQQYLFHYIRTKLD